MTAQLDQYVTAVNQYPTNQRFQAAAYRVAYEVTDESVETVNHENRLILANRVLWNDSYHLFSIMVGAVTTDDNLKAAVDLAPTEPVFDDADIYAAVAANWDIMANADAQG